MFQPFQIDDLATFPERLEALLDKQRVQIDAIVKSDANNYQSILKPLQDMDETLECFFTPLSHLNSRRREKTS